MVWLQKIQCRSKKRKQNRILKNLCMSEKRPKLGVHYSVIIALVYSTDLKKNYPLLMLYLS